MPVRKLRVAQVGYGMFGADVVAGTMWDLQRNGLAPYLDRLGLDDWSQEYTGIEVEMVTIGTRTRESAERAVGENQAHTGLRPLPYYGESPWEAILVEVADLDVLVVATPDHLHAAPILAALNHGVHVITEKPMCLRLEEARQIAKLAANQALFDEGKPRTVTAGCGAEGGWRTAPPP